MDPPATGRLYEGGSAEREEVEVRLIDECVPIHALTRSAVDAARGSSSGLVVVDSPSREAGPWGFGYQVTTTRAAPGFVNYLVPHLRRGPPGAVEEGLRLLLRHAHDRKVLQIEAIAYGCTDAEMRELREMLQVLGFKRRAQRWTYATTLFADLRPPDHEIFTRLHRTARRHIRAVEKKPVTVSEIRTPSLAARVESLHRESMRRTGGDYRSEDWASWFRIADACPDAARIVGLFDSELEGPGALLSFAVGLRHGEIGQYALSGSTRDLRVKVPLHYALLWDLMLWAKKQGATVFDFGGVTSGTADDEDPLGGISDFKRYFSRDLREVQSEHVFTLSPVWSSVASVVSASARAARGLLRL